MRIISLAFAAAVMAVGLAVSGGASAEQKPSAHQILSKGKIIYAEGDDGAQHQNIWAAYNDQFYSCRVSDSGIGCGVWENRQRRNKDWSAEIVREGEIISAACENAPCGVGHNVWIRHNDRVYFCFFTTSGMGRAGGFSCGDLKPYTNR